MGGVLALLGRDEEQSGEWEAARQHLKVGTMHVDIGMNTAPGVLDPPLLLLHH